jgi:hypothetical protein
VKNGFVKEKYHKGINRPAIKQVDRAKSNWADFSGATLPETSKDLL